MKLYGSTVESYYDMEEQEDGSILTKHEIMSGDSHSAIANITWRKND
jgi:medium-chain acyl-[acyl-carrier-protein] hydrolase